MHHYVTNFCYKMMHCGVFDAMWDLWDESIKSSLIKIMAWLLFILCKNISWTTEPIGLFKNIFKGNFNQNYGKFIQEMHSKMSSSEYQPCCSGLNVLKHDNWFCIINSLNPGVIKLGQHWFRQWLGAWWPQAINWTNVDINVSSVRYCVIHLIAISEETLMKSKSDIINLEYSSHIP